MAPKSQQEKDDAQERNLPGMPPVEERRGPNPPPATKTAWTRGDGGMEGPAGWNSEFGRAGFASTGERANARPNPPNPLEEKSIPNPSPTEQDRSPAGLKKNPPRG